MHSFNVILFLKTLEFSSFDGLCCSFCKIQDFSNGNFRDRYFPINLLFRVIYHSMDFQDQLNFLEFKFLHQINFVLQLQILILFHLQNFFEIQDAFLLVYTKISSCYDFLQMARTHNHLTIHFHKMELKYSILMVDSHCNQWKVSSYQFDCFFYFRSHL